MRIYGSPGAMRSPRAMAASAFVSPAKEEPGARLFTALCHVLRKPGHLHERLDELSSGNERAFALYPVYRAERFKLRHGVARGHAACAVPLAELAFGGERLIRPEAAVFDAAEEVVAYGFIESSFLHDAQSSVPARACDNRKLVYTSCTFIIV